MYRYLDKLFILRFFGHCVSSCTCTLTTLASCLLNGLHPFLCRYGWYINFSWCKYFFSVNEYNWYCSFWGLWGHVPTRTSHFEPRLCGCLALYVKCALWLLCIVPCYTQIKWANIQSYPCFFFHTATLSFSARFIFFFVNIKSRKTSVVWNLKKVSVWVLMITYIWRPDLLVTTTRESDVCMLECASTT